MGRKSKYQYLNKIKNFGQTPKEEAVMSENGPAKILRCWPKHHQQRAMQGRNLAQLRSRQEVKISQEVKGDSGAGKYPQVTRNLWGALKGVSRQEKFRGGMPLSGS